MTPRRLKPYKVDEVTDRRLGVTVTIYFDRDDKVFFGCMPGDGVRYEHKDIDEAKSAVRAAIPKHHGMTWKQIIEINVGHTEYGFGRGHTERTMCNFEFDYERYEIGKSPIGDTWLRRDFRSPGEARPHILGRWDRKEDVESHYVSRQGRTGFVEKFEFEIPYTDEAWAAIKAIEARVQAARTQLLAMFRQPDLAKQLTAIGSKFALALPAQHGRGRHVTKPIERPCPSCGAAAGAPCRQVGPGGGQSGPPPREKLGIAMVTFHAKRRRAAKAAERVVAGGTFDDVDMLVRFTDPLDAAFQERFPTAVEVAERALSANAATVMMKHHGHQIDVDAFGGFTTDEQEEP